MEALKLENGGLGFAVRGLGFKITFDNYGMKYEFQINI